MNSKPPFEAEHNSICAYPDIPILDFYEGYFDSVYIILHPFVSLDEKEASYKQITWKEFIELAGFSDINQLDIALRNFIRGLKTKWENEADVNRVRRTCDAHKLRIPFEGKFQDILEHDMLVSLQEQGHDYMFIADEHGFERKVIYIQDLIEKKDKIELSYAGHENWYTNKHEILYTTHWDSHFTLLCSTRETIKSILDKHPYEGFYCDSKTEIYWSLKNGIRD